MANLNRLGASPITSTDGKIAAPVLIRGSDAIMSGLLGAAMRLDGSDIRIRGSRIVEVGHLRSHPNDRILDASDCVIYPGWVSTHHHLLQSIM